MAPSPTKGGSPKSSPSTSRRRYQNPKYKEYFVNKPSGYCPKCNKLVGHNDDGVACAMCNAFWHYACANTNHDEIETTWHGKEFLCEEHRKQSPENGYEPATLALQVDNGSPKVCYDEKSLNIRDIKINEYHLNEKNALKKKLNGMNNTLVITPKDNHRQQSVTMSTPTYHLIVENLLSCGEQVGLEVKRQDVDGKGNNVECSFNANIRLNDGCQVPFTIICYHTTNRMLFQLLGNPTETKIQGLSVFVNQTLKINVENLEKTAIHQEVKESMLKELKELIGSPLNKPKIKETETESKKEESLTTMVNDHENDPDTASQDKDAQKNAVESGEQKESAELIISLKIQLDNAMKEKRKLSGINEQLEKKMKGLDGYEKAVKSTQQKLDKMTQMKNQMNAAVQSLKQEKEVITKQLETQKTTIESQTATVDSYVTIIKRHEQNLLEKDEIIKKQETKLKENEIGLCVHQDIACRFMDELNSSRNPDEDGETEEDEEEEYKKETRKMYAKLREEEEKSKQLEGRMSTLQASIDSLKLTLAEEEKSHEGTKAEIEIQREAHTKEITKMSQDNKKNVKLLKDALNKSEKTTNDCIHHIKQLEEQIKEINLDKQVRNVLNTASIGVNTESFECNLLEMDKAASNSHALENKEKELTHDITVLVENNKLLEVQTQQLHSKVGQLEAQLIASKDHLESVDTKAKEAVLKAAEAIKDKDIRERELIDAKKVVNELLSLNEQLKITNDDITQQLESKRSDTKVEEAAQIERVREANKSLAEILATKESDIKGLNEHSRFMEEHSEELTKKMKDLEVKINAASKEIEAANTKEKKAQLKSAESIKEKDAFSVKFNAAKQEISQLMALNNQLKLANEELSKKTTSTRQYKTAPAENEGCNPQETYPGCREKDEEDEIIRKAKNICYRELKQKNGCSRGSEACRYSHNITQEIWEKRDKILSSIGHLNFCVNEYKNPGSCFKGDKCGFNHKINEEQRRNPRIMSQMERVAEKLKRGKFAEEQRADHYNCCIHEYKEKGNCTWKEKCHYSHDISDEQRTDKSFKEKMKNKMDEIEKNKTTSKIQTKKNDGNISVPLNFLEKMYQLLEKADVKAMRF